MTNSQQLDDKPSQKRVALTIDGDDASRLVKTLKGMYAGGEFNGIVHVYQIAEDGEPALTGDVSTGGTHNLWLRFTHSEDATHTAKTLRAMAKAGKFSDTFKVRETTEDKNPVAAEDERGDA